VSEAELRKELHWLRDLNEAIDKILSHPQFKDGKDAFEKDEYYRVWILYHMERIGECASRLRREHDYDNKFPSVDWAGAVGMRRRLVHSYWDTDLEKVWQGVEYLPKFKELVEAVLKAKEPS
jgi:uncharacterized protein with HEPN domain